MNAERKVIMWMDMKNLQLLNTENHSSNDTLPESCMFHWIQITLKEHHSLEEKGFIPKGSGYHYTNAIGVEMVEHHVNSCHIFQDQMNTETEFRRKLSICN